MLKNLIMKIIYTKENKKGFRQINLYTKDSQKKTDTNSNQFLNFKTPKDLNRRKYISFIRSIVQRAQSHKLEKISFNYGLVKSIKVGGIDDYWKARLFVENLIIAEYKFDRYKSEKSERIKEILVFGDISRNEKIAFAEAQKISSAVNVARDLANTPGGEMTPTLLTNQVKKLFKGSKVKVKVLEESDTRKLKMNLFLSVGQGSKEKSKFIIAEYNGGKKGEKPIVLVGKGVTFDTGGINLKPSASILGMNMDMSGAAIVASTLKAVVDLGIKKNVVVLIPAVENSVSGEAYRPGDIIKSMSGKTVEVLNTDAEGRLILADALTYSERYNPKVIIDVATLTGASLLAVGQKASVVLGKDTDLNRKLMDYGEQTGDYLWELPFWDEFEKDIDGNFADIMNTGKTRYGGTITAGMFLYQFVKNFKKKTKWAHIDMAPRMESATGDNLNKGATGEPVRMLVEFVKNYK